MSNISETTKPEHKGQNQAVIDWLTDVDPRRTFLRTAERSWSYGETLVEVGRRRVERAVALRPSLTPESVFDVLAGLAGAGLTVLPPGTQVASAEGHDLVVFTSGSSGRPKGVRISKKALTAAASASVEHLDHGPGDDWLLAMPLHHVGGLSILVRQAFSGGSVTLQPGFEGGQFAAAMKGRSTMVSVVPTMLRRLLDHGPFSDLKAVLVGGGPIPKGLLEAAREAGVPAVPTYGMTESFGQVATLRLGARLEYKAHPLPGVDIKIRNGRIVIRSPQLFDGYLGGPDRTDEWFETNDLGAVDEEGAVRVLGRADSVIVSGGENVSPELVENALSDVVDDVGAVGLDDEEWGQLVAVGFVGEVQESVVLEAARATLPRFAVPKLIKRVNAVPRNSLGKIDRTALKALMQS